MKPKLEDEWNIKLHFGHIAYADDHITVIGIAHAKTMAIGERLCILRNCICITRKLLDDATTLDCQIYPG